MRKEEKLKTIKQVCEEYSVSRKTVERWMKAGLPYIKLNNNNGSVRIDEADIQMMISGMTNESIVNRIRWGEYQAKMAISYDLNEDKKNNSSSKIKYYDDLKFKYPQDFYVETTTADFLINVSTIDKEYFNKFNLEEQEEIFRKKFLIDNQKIKLLILLVGINNNLDENKFVFDPKNVVNIVAVNIKNITSLDIMKYVNQY
ncbi:helix-turn-helix transcriptional regulator [Bacillus mycoides]